MPAPYANSPTDRRHRVGEEGHRDSFATCTGVRGESIGYSKLTYKKVRQCVSFPRDNELLTKRDYMTKVLFLIL